MSTILAASTLDELTALSLKIHANPEVSWSETEAHALLTEYLLSRGFHVTRSAHGIATAFIAEWSNRPTSASAADDDDFTVAFLSEYDALPGIGHACGHNLIAISGIAAALSLRELVTKRLDADIGGRRITIRLLGTPAEEDTGGKINLIDAGALDDVNVALMVHPGNVNCVRGKYLACQSIQVEFFGSPAHAAAEPWNGVNALDALISAFNAVGLVRQQLHPTARVHGVIRKGGDAANVIPEHTAAEFMIRAETVETLDVVRRKIDDVFHGAARSAGCTARVRYDPTFKEVMVNETLALRFEHHAKSLGCEMLPLEEEAKAVFGSTDMGNVSQKVPGIHPIFSLDCGTGINIHTNEFREVACTDKAHRNTFRAAECLALTALDCVTDQNLLKAITAEFNESMRRKNEKI